MLSFVNALCLSSVEGVLEWRQECVVRVLDAKNELMELKKKKEEEEEKMMIRSSNGLDDKDDEQQQQQQLQQQLRQQRESELLQIIASEGRQQSWNGKQTIRIYFPDEGSAALARRDWTSILPPCVVYDACGGVASRNRKEKRSDVISIFYCPRASESESVEKLLLEAEESTYGGGGDDDDDEEEGGGGRAQHKMTIMVNPLLVDMGVTGFGMAGRRLRERLIDGLIPAYYLRTLAWGALTRCYPNLFTVWMEDENEEGGYRMIQAMDRLPSNPEGKRERERERERARGRVKTRGGETIYMYIYHRHYTFLRLWYSFHSLFLCVTAVEDIYDIATGNRNAPKEGMGFLNALGDFVNGMTRL
jgi:hypothetical protein